MTAVVAAALAAAVGEAPPLPLRRPPCALQRRTLRLPQQGGVRRGRLLRPKLLKQ